MYDFDEGSSGSSKGPFINWHARETMDGEIGSKTFSLRDQDGKKDINAAFKRGVMFDLDTLKTGWCYTTGIVGVSPEWVWNETPARFGPQPPDRGDDRWKKGFEVRIAVSKDQAATWSQAGAGAWNGLVNMMKAVREDGGGGEGMAAVIKMTGAEKLEFKKGSTVFPVLELKKWADKPDCLIEDASAPEEEEPSTDEF